MEDLTGRQFGPYRVVEPLGEGGMAAVYKGYQPSVDRYVALKVLPRRLASDPEFVGRFEQEARVIARLQHPHILPVFDYGQTDGFTYIVMPYVGGGTLAKRLTGKPAPLVDIARWITQLGEALDYAHGHGVVHRDLKPSNVLIDERENALLTDFGIAKLVESTASFTATGGVLGTPTYMSPEQALGKPADHRSDIYSLGVILYEMATGRVPFRAETPVAVLMKHVNDPLPPPRTLRPDLPEPLERVILKSLAKAPRDRYSTAGEMVAAVRRALAESRTADRGDLAVAHPETIGARPASVSSGIEGGAGQVKAGATIFPRWPIPSRVLVVGATVLGVMGVAATAWFLLLGPRILAAGMPVVGSNPTSPLAASASPLSRGFHTATSTLSPTAGAASSRLWEQGTILFPARSNGKLAVFELVLGSGGSPSILVSPAANQALQGVSLSPDGERFAYFVYGVRAEVVDRSSGVRVETTDNCNSPTWSPDGIRIVCGTTGSRFIIFDATTGARLAEVDPGVSGAVIPAWSPSGSEFAFGALTPDGSSVWRTTADGTGSTRLTEEGFENYAPSWSPDGEWIAYQSDVDSQTSEIWVMDRNGGLKRRLTNTAGGWSRAPTWSPDGRWLAFVSSQSGSIGADYGELFVVSLDTGEIVQLTSTSGQVYDWRPWWGR